MVAHFFMSASSRLLFFFFFNDTATTEIYTLSLHDALPICSPLYEPCLKGSRQTHDVGRPGIRKTRTTGGNKVRHRSEEHTSELQSRSDLVCRLLLEKKKRNQGYTTVPMDGIIIAQLAPCRR